MAIINYQYHDISTVIVNIDIKAMTRILIVIVNIVCYNKFPREDLSSGASGDMSSVATEDVPSVATEDVSSVATEDRSPVATEARVSGCNRS